MRNPKNSWDRSDSEFKATAETEILDDGEIKKQSVCFDALSIGPNDHKLMMSLAKGGPVHAKYRRMITVYVDITAPLYWWKEFDTYKVGTVANSCSTMHKLTHKKFELDDFSHDHLVNHIRVEPRCENEKVQYAMPLGTLNLVISALNTCREAYIRAEDALEAKGYWWQMIQLLPTSYNQKRTVMLNYEVLAGIYPMRKNHKLNEWRDFCAWIESLPYSELITGGQGTNVLYLCDKEQCDKCNNEDCHHTPDIRHAVNFEKLENTYWEKSFDLISEGGKKDG